MQAHPAYKVIAAPTNFSSRPSRRHTGDHLPPLRPGCPKPRPGVTHGAQSDPNWRDRPFGCRCYNGPTAACNFIDGFHDVPRLRTSIISLYTAAPKLFSPTKVRHRFHGCDFVYQHGKSRIFTQRTATLQTGYRFFSKNNPGQRLHLPCAVTARFQPLLLARAVLTKRRTPMNLMGTVLKIQCSLFPLRVDSEHPGQNAFRKRARRTSTFLAAARGVPLAHLSVDFFKGVPGQIASR